MAAVVAAVFPGGFVGCEPMPSTGRPFEPVPVAAPRGGARPPASGSAPAAAPAPQAGGHDPFGDDRGAQDGAAALGSRSPALAPADGAARTVLAADGSVLELPPDAAPTAAAPVGSSGGPPTLVWDAAAPLPEQSFGVQLVAVIPDRFPPRAVLALPTGEEVVVTPGAMVPAHGLVVLAIGQNGVRVAHVSPSGYQAKVVTETISVLSPKEAPPVAP